MTFIIICLLSKENCNISKWITFIKLFSIIQILFQKKVGPLVAVKCSRQSFSIILDRTRPDVLQSYGKSNPEREQIILIQLLQKAPFFASGIGKRSISLQKWKGYQSSNTSDVATIIIYSITAIILKQQWVKKF